MESAEILHSSKKRMAILLILLCLSIVSFAAYLFLPPFETVAEYAGDKKESIVLQIRRLIKSKHGPVDMAIVERVKGGNNPIYSWDLPEYGRIYVNPDSGGPPEGQYYDDCPGGWGKLGDPNLRSFGHGSVFYDYAGVSIAQCGGEAEDDIECRVFNKLTAKSADFTTEQKPPNCK